VATFEDCPDKAGREECKAQSLPHDFRVEFRRVCELFDRSEASVLQIGQPGVGSHNGLYQLGIWLVF
jgi:hypothetical protein